LNQTVNFHAERLANYSEKAVKTLRKLHWKQTDHWEILLAKNARITAKLALESTTQNILKTL
ncbi:enoyl-CoA hydratase/isomerase family protein, partial [Flavobacteriaceae bacterium]|nr:enoyl-CoA hydratase/isomerase family protein [Flavobacteriaceae bacterium]